MSDEDVEDLQNNLLVKFSASNPYHFESHHQSKVKVKGSYYQNKVCIYFFK